MKTKHTFPKRILHSSLVGLLIMCMILSAIPAFAAEVPEATIHTDRPCSITLYKYDWTNAAKDGIWSENSYVTTGQYDANVNNILGNAVPAGSTDGKNHLGNSETSNGYAIKGVEYSYLKVADAYQFSEAAADDRTDSRIELLYAFDKMKAADLLAAIGLPDGTQSDVNANALPGNEANWYYRSDVLNKAIAAALLDNATVVKDALETYMAAQGATAMPLTDENGRTIATNLPVGLYLLVETKVPEMVTCTTNPFFLSLPMTSVDGGGDGSVGNNAHVTTGGHDWLYDVTLYPKNETGLVTLEKTVREAKADGGKNNGSDVISDGYSHNGTGSAGDVMEYQIISTLPTITSQATALTNYSFYDTISEALTYNKALKDVKIEFFTDKDCTDKVTAWTQADGKFTVNYSSDDRNMTIDVTESGLAEINGQTSNVNGKLYVGYSNYTMRVTYTATINSNNSITSGDSGNGNKVVLTWKRTSADFFDTLVDDSHVYSYGIDLTKLFSDKAQDEAEAAGMYGHVKFKIYNNTDKCWVTAQRNDAEGIYYVTGHKEAEADATIFTPYISNGIAGHVIVKGLEDDEYIITEVETANGYTLLKNSISVVISAVDDGTRPCKIYAEDVLGILQNDPRYAADGGKDLALNLIPQKHLAHNMLTASAIVDGKPVTMLEDKGSVNALTPLTVINTRGFDIPQTGDITAVLLPVAGAALIGGIILLLIIFRKKGDGQPAHK